MKPRRATIISVVAVLAMCVLIFAMSAMPADDSTALSTGVIWHIVGFIVPDYDRLSPAEQLRWQEMLQFPVRKTAHFSEYALLGMLTLNMLWRLAREGSWPSPRAWLSAHAPTSWKLALVAWALTVAYSVTDEVHQVFVPGRTCKVMDIGIDAAGALTGIVLMTLALMIVRKLRNRTRG